MAANLPLSILLLGGGTVVVYAAVTDQQGGPLGVIGRALRGQKQGSAHTAFTAAEIALDPTTQAAAGAGAADPATQAAAGSPVAAAALQYARQLEGVPYRWGGTTPAGFDCSGLVQYVYAKAGVQLPRTTVPQALSGKAVAGIAQAKLGDLIFFGTPPHHVGLYNGAGMMVNALKTGTFVREDNIADIGQVTAIRRVA